MNAMALATPGNALNLNGLTVPVMMGTTPVTNPASFGGIIRGAIGTLITPTAPPTAQEMWEGQLVSTNTLRQAKRLYVGNVPMGCDQVCVSIY